MSSPWFNQVTQSSRGYHEGVGWLRSLRKQKRLSEASSSVPVKQLRGGTVTDGRGRRPGLLELGTDPQTQAPHQSHEALTPLTIYLKEQRKGAYVRTAVLGPKRRLSGQEKAGTPSTGVRWKYRHL